MKSDLRRWLGALFLVGAAGAFRGHAQLYLDNAGPRDVLFAAPEDFLKGDNRLRLKLDTDAQSLGATYFWRPPWEKGAPGGGHWVGALVASVRAVDGLEELVKFDRWPGTELAGLINWTSDPHLSRNSAGEVRSSHTFANLRFGWRHESQAFLDPGLPPETQIQHAEFNGASAIASAGWLWSGRYGFALSVGYERVSSYEDLPKVSVKDVSQIISLPDGGQRLVGSVEQTLRIGRPEGENTLPATATVTWDLGRKVDRWVKAIPFVPDSTNNTYGLVLAGYGKFRASDQDKPRHTLGTSLTLRRQLSPSGGPFDRVKNEQWTMPLSVFVEWDQPFGGEADRVRAGLAAIYSFW